MLAALAGATRREEACALVDASDNFDPASAAAAGVDLDRCCGCVAANTSALPCAKITRRSALGRLEQVLKVTDLLLQGGGFGMVVLDLGDIPAESARRVPLTSWFRFRRAVEPTATVLLIVEREPCAKTCASLVVRLQRTAVCAHDSAPSARNGISRMESLEPDRTGHSIDKYGEPCGPAAWHAVACRSGALVGAAQAHASVGSRLRAARCVVILSCRGLHVCLYLHSRFSGGGHRARGALLRDRAVAVLEGKPPLVRVAALNDKARLLGMEIGMTKLQAAIFAAAERRLWSTQVRREKELRKLNFPRGAQEASETHCRSLTATVAGAGGIVARRVTGCGPCVHSARGGHAS